MKKILNKKCTFYIPLLIIMIISFFNMANAKLLSSLYSNNLIKQIIWYGIGFLIIFIVRKVNTKNFLKYANIYYYISVLLLGLVLIIGKETNGAKAWFNLGAFSFQPSELVKFTLVLYLSKISASYHYKGILNEIKYIGRILILTLIPSILVFLEPDTGAIIFYFLIALTILAITPVKKFWFVILFLILVLGLGLFTLLYLFNQDLLIDLIGTSFFYRIERLVTFQTKNSYQLESALIAIGSTSLLGTGLNSILLYIPEAPTDFIFAFTISNWGLIGGFIVLLCYLIMDIYLVNRYFKCQDKMDKGIMASFIVMLFWGEVINIGMNLGLLPIIGIPLPFLSYGGSTLIIYFLFLGLILKEKSHKLI